MELDFYQFVPDFYRKERYEECYRLIFHPVNGKDIWERTAYTDLQPPPIKRQPGRPKKKRNKDPSELLREDGQMKRASCGTKCSRCHQLGHNKATCKLPPPPPPLENPTDATITPATNQSTENPPTANQTNANPPSQAAGNPPPTTSLNQTDANPLPTSQQQSATQASTNSQAPVATQGSFIAQPSGSS